MQLASKFEHSRRVDGRDMARSCFPLSHRGVSANGGCLQLSNTPSTTIDPMPSRESGEPPRGTLTFRGGEPRVGLGQYLDNHRSGRLQTWQARGLEVLDAPLMLSAPQLTRPGSGAPDLGGQRQAESHPVGLLTFSATAVSGEPPRLTCCRSGDWTLPQWPRAENHRTGL